MKKYSSFMLYVFPLTVIALPLSIFNTVATGFQWYSLLTWISVPFVIFNFVMFLIDMK